MSVRRIEDDIPALVDGVGSDEPRALGRAISLALSDGPAGDALREALESTPAGSHRIGVTGSPGVGKSTLVAALARAIRERGDRIGVVASDPSSPYSGGAFLGDRVRLAGFRLADDPGVFFRSIAHREAGGVGDATARAARVIEAAGYPWIFLETVGAGQSELAVRELADTVLVVISPDQGDEVQLLKAGILEIADIFVVNRADSAGARRFRRLLEERVHFKGKGGDWAPPVVETEAIRGEGIPELLDAIERHREHLRGTESRGETHGG